MFARNTSDKNYYETLGIPQTATVEDIKKAYYKLALKYHPDKAAIANIAPEKAEILFKEINNAHDTLSDPTKRMYYDMDLNKVNNGSNLHNLWEERPSRAGFNHRGNADKFNRTQKSWSYSPQFWEQEQAPKRAMPPEPTAEDRKVINDFINNDEVKLLDSYLNKHNFSSQSLLKELLAFAAQNGCLQVVKYLLEERKIKPNVFYTENPKTINLAAGSGNLDLVKYLLEKHHLDIETLSRINDHTYGATPLNFAVGKGHDHIVNYLIKKGANVNPLAPSWKRIQYRNILSLALSLTNRKLIIIKSLIEAGTKLEDSHVCQALETGDLEIVQFFLQKIPSSKNYYFQTPRAAVSAIESGNLNLLKYLEQHEKLNIFACDKNGYIKDINIYLLKAAAKSGNIEMMRYLLEEKGLLAECYKIENASEYIEEILSWAVIEGACGVKEVEVQERLRLVRYLMEKVKLIPPLDKLAHIIKKDASWIGCSIEMNAYLQSYLPALAEHRDMLLATAKGLNTLSKEELFRLYNLDIIKKGERDDFQNVIHFQIQSRKITNDELKWLISTNIQFKKDALFYYSNYGCEDDLSQLQCIIESGIDINIENSYGDTAIHHAFRQGPDGYNAIVKFLIDKGADVYKRNRFGKSINDFLMFDKEFQAQLERVSKRNAEHHADSQSSYTSYKR